MLKAVMPESLQVGKKKVRGGPHFGICHDKSTRVIVATRSLQLEAVHKCCDLFTVFPAKVAYSLMV